MTGEVPVKKVDVRWVVSRIPLVLIVGLFIAFAIQNADSVEVRFLNWSFSAPRIVMLLGAALLGAITRDLMRYRGRNRPDEESN